MNLSKQQATKSIFRNQRHFCVPTMKYQTQKQGEKSHYYNNNKNKAPEDKLNQGVKGPVLRKLQNTEERN